MTVDPSEKMLFWFESGHLPADLREISIPFQVLANDLVQELPSSAERSAGLRKLLEAKDCFVRAAIGARDV